MQKFSLILLYALVFTFAIQYFFPAQPTSPNSSTIILNVADDSLVIPNLPIIHIVNNTASGFIISPCSDIQIHIDSQSLTDIEKVAPEFCNSLDLPVGSTPLNLSPLARILADRPGKYSITANTPLGERVVLFSLSEPGSLRSLLTEVVYNPIYNLFVALLTFIPGHSLGWAILVITLIIRFILLVPQHHMLQSQKKLQVIQPKIKELQKKYKDDQAKLGMEMLELYKKEKVNPMGSCLPLLIQMPILIGLYWVISGITESSNFYHLYSFFENFNPASIDFHFFGLNLLQIGGLPAIVFGLALGGIQYIQAKLSFGYQPVPEKKTEEETSLAPATPEMALDPEMMKKMMLYMFPLMIAVSAYFFPLGVGLYWFIGTLFVIAQQWYVNTSTKK